MNKLLNKAISIVIVCVATVALPASAADYYVLKNVKRLDQDLYRDTVSGLIIKTRWCYHYTYGEEAVLKWEGDYSYSNEIIFEDDDRCDVKSVH